MPGSFPFPGGWLLGSVLLVNLLAAHAIRFKLSWKRSGILLLHAGIILMMIGEFITAYQTDPKQLDSLMDEKAYEAFVTEQH